MTRTQLILTPQRTATPIEGGSLDLLIRLQAPAAPCGDATATRLPLRLAIVIDRSGSMDGPPLAEAVRCAQQLIARLVPGDEVAVVLYDDRVSVPIPMQPVARVGAAAAALSGVISGGSTALYAGWREGLQQLGEAHPGAINRVVLLSDGQANAGPSALAEFEPEVRDALARGLSTSTVGLGRGFNEDLMLGLARVGGGQSYYGQTADDLADAFDEEFALLQALCARRLKVHLSAAAGVQFEVLSDLPQGSGWIGLPDLAFGAEAWALVRLHIAAAQASEVDKRHLLTARVEGDAQTGVTLDGVPVRLDLAGLPQALIATLPEDPLVVERRAEVLFARALQAVHAALHQGSPAAVQAELARAEALADGQPWLVAKLEHLRALVARDREMASKEAVYSTRRMNSRLVSAAPVMFSMDETASVEIPAFLRRKSGEGRGKKGV